MKKETLQITLQLTAFIIGFTAALYFFENKYDDIDAISVVSVTQFFYIWWLYKKYKQSLPKSLVTFFSKFNVFDVSSLSVLMVTFAFASIAVLLTNLVLLLDDWAQTTTLFALVIGAIYVTFVAKN